MKQFMQIQIFFLHRENKLEPDINSYTALLVVHAEAGNVEGIMEVRDHVWLWISSFIITQGFFR